MNKKQKIFLSIIALVLLLLLLFPPFTALAGNHLGYYFLADPRLLQKKVVMKVNVGLLLVQALIVMFIGLICFFSLKDDNR
jgi:hypothetical protein